MNQCFEGQKVFGGYQKVIGEDGMTEQQMEINQSMWDEPIGVSVRNNVGFLWSKKTKLLRASWILKNVRGEIHLHSRRPFGNIKSFLDAKFMSLIWVFESMISHHVDNIVFKTEAEWSLVGVSALANRCAQKIAKSVTMEMRYQYYVGRGEPQWILNFVEADKQRWV
ncbi:hypothetical protein N665_0512s0019 [Sinapis alba]|nr:hypothetical protein N665_0512s0019 [Sinapis alba]